MTLEAAPNTAVEGEAVTVWARLHGAVLAHDVTIPVTTMRGTAEEGDHGTLGSIRIASGQATGGGTIATWEDDDVDDETFTVALGSPLPSSVVARSPSSVELFIVDDDELTVALTSNTLRPAEGSSARLTATLSHPAPEGGVTLQFTADGAGDNPAAPITDYTLDPEGEAQNSTAPVTIAEGQRTATGWLRVVNDTEPEEDEGVVVGISTDLVLCEDPDRCEYPELDLTIPANDGGGGTGVVAWLDAVPNPVEEGSEVEVEVSLSKALGEAVTIPLTVTRGTSEEGDHGTLDEIEIAAGETVGTGTIWTAEDGDEDDDNETFTVRLGSLPAGVRAGTPSRVEVVIEDRDQPRVWLEADPNRSPRARR